MRLALFDIDETILRGDSETLWCRYLTRNGIYDMSRIDEFVQDYYNGSLDFAAFMEFQLEPLAALPTKELLRHRATFLESEIVPAICTTLRERIDEHLRRDERVLTVSAAHDFLAAPITELFGIDEGLFTIAERHGDSFTGGVAGTPCYREGKIQHVTDWLEQEGTSWAELEASCFYSDSHNDEPLLRHVDRAVCVRPDARLRQVAAKLDWEVID